MMGVYINFSSQLPVVSCQFWEPTISNWISAAAWSPSLGRFGFATKGGIGFARGCQFSAVQKASVGSLIKDLLQS